MPGPTTSCSTTPVPPATSRLYRLAGSKAGTCSRSTPTICFYPDEQAALVAALEAAGVPVDWIKVSSPKGHDAFLTEPHLFKEALRKALD